MAYIGGRYRVWVYGQENDISLRMYDYIQTEQEARAVANAEWVKDEVRRVLITRNGFDAKKRRKPATVVQQSKSIETEV